MRKIILIFGFTLMSLLSFSQTSNDDKFYVPKLDTTISKSSNTDDLLPPPTVEVKKEVVRNVINQYQQSYSDRYHGEWGYRLDIPNPAGYSGWGGWSK